MQAQFLSTTKVYPLDALPKCLALPVKQCGGFLFDVVARSANVSRKVKLIISTEVVQKLRARRTMQLSKHFDAKN